MTCQKTKENTSEYYIPLHSLIMYAFILPFPQVIQKAVSVLQRQTP